VYNAHRAWLELGRDETRRSKEERICSDVIDVSGDSDLGMAAYSPVPLHSTLPERESLDKEWNHPMMLIKKRNGPQNKTATGSEFVDLNG
jgi:hypothetical protein